MVCLTAADPKEADTRPTVATFSLINVWSRNPDGTVNGYWIQDHVGTLESAKEVARQTEAVNSNKIEEAVVADVRCPVAILNFWSNRVRLA